MSPRLIAELQKLWREMATITDDGGRCYERNHSGWNFLKWYVDLKRIERAFDEDEPMERRPFVQEEFDEFRADPRNQKLVDDILEVMAGDYPRLDDIGYDDE